MELSTMIHMTRTGDKCLTMETVGCKSDEGYKSSHSATSDEEEGDFMCQREELSGRYFRAMSATTEILLRTLVGMIFVTWATQGYTTVIDFCRKELRWKSVRMKSLFTSCERKNLKLNPVQVPFSTELNVKLLTNVWRELGEDVTQHVRDLDRLRKEAVHDPPCISSMDQLRQHLLRVYSQQKELCDDVLKYCHLKLKQFLSSLWKEEAILKQNVSVIFRELMVSKESLYILSLNSAVASMESTYQLLCIDQNKMPDLHRSQSCVDNVNAVADKRKKLGKIASSLEAHVEQESSLKQRIDEIKFLYVDLILRGSLSDIIRELNSVGIVNVSQNELQEWYQQFRHNQKDRKSRLEILGRSEILSHRAGVLSHSTGYDGPFVWDINKWLLTKKASMLNVKKVFSLIKRSDTGEVIPFDQYLNRQLPQVTVLSGPVGSGKTCMCHYLFNKWYTSCSTVQCLRDVQLLIFLREENVRANSFVHHLKTELFQRSFSDLENNNEVFTALQQLKVVFVVDKSSGSRAGFMDATKELVSGLGKNTAFITTQPQDQKEVLSILKGTGAESLVVHLQPLGKPELTDLCMNFMAPLYPLQNSVAADQLQLPASEESFVRGQPKGRSLPISSSIQDFSAAQRVHLSSEPRSGLSGRASFTNDDVENTVKNFVTELLGEERVEELLYPLPVAYMIMLWLEDSRKLSRITTVSRLFEEVIGFCNDKLNARIQDIYTVGKRFINKKSKEKLRILFDMASRVFDCEGNVVSSPDISDSVAEHNLSDVCSDGLFPFLMCCSEGNYHQLNHSHLFLHPSLIHVLHAQRTIYKLTLQRDRWLVFFKNDLRDIFPLPSVRNMGRKYVHVIKCLCGFLSSSQHLKTNTAAYIVELYKNAGVDIRDYPSWVSLLQEGVWSPVLVKATLSVLAANTTWKVPRKSCQETRAVCQLVTHGAYLPREVIVTQELPAEVTSVLLSHPVIDVRILPPRSFHGVSEEGQHQDELLQSLAEAGSVTELWGKVGVVGAAALASMTRIHAMYVYLTSLDSVNTFCRSISSCVALRYLDLHLNLPTSTTTAADAIVSILQCPTSIPVILKLSGIEDSSWAWAVSVVKQLGGRFQEVHLAKTHISPSTLQALKQELHPIPVHASL